MIIEHSEQYRTRTEDGRPKPQLFLRGGCCKWFEAIVLATARIAPNIVHAKPKAFVVDEVLLLLLAVEGAAFIAKMTPQMVSAIAP
jgi:hypothetical protein